jgi:hypothetical protein
MRTPASTDKEILLREINEVEAVLANISRVVGCTCIIDPTETLADRVKHLGVILTLEIVQNGQLRQKDGAKKADIFLDALGAMVDHN